MRALTIELRREILQSIASFARSGDAASQDSEQFWKHYLVVPRHLKAFDVEAVLITGERGAGKSQLFQAMVHRDGQTLLAPHLAKVRMHTGTVTWLSGYGEGKDFFDPINLRQALERPGRNPDQNAADLWLAYLLRLLPLDLFGEAERAALAGLRAPAGIEATAILDALGGLGGTATAILDAVDTRLDQQGRHVVIAYDELDRLGGFDYGLMARALRGLIGFWAQYFKRWGHLRSKLFVRTDLFRQYASFLGPDLAKLAAARVEITWDDDTLRFLLVKRLLNAHDWLPNCARALRCPFQHANTVGCTPSMTKTAAEWKPFVDAIISPYMGANPRKGITWHWMLNHIRDGKGAASPRPLLLLLEKAATQQDPASARLDPRQLIHHSHIRAALDEVSREEVNKAKEFPWLEGLHERIDGLQVPVTRADLVARIRPRWKERWAQNTDLPLPPAENADAFIDVLIEWGIFSRRANGKIDVPDLYRTGLGLKRKGGVEIG